MIKMEITYVGGPKDGFKQKVDPKKASKPIPITSHINAEIGLVEIGQYHLDIAKAQYIWKPRFKNELPDTG